MTTGDTQNGLHLQEATSRYLATLTEDRRAGAQQEIHRFARWYGGWEGPFQGITASAVSNYAENLAQTDGESASKIEAFKAFLVYAKKQGWSGENLVLGLNIKKSKSKTRGPARKIVREPVPLSQARYDELTNELVNLKNRRIETIGDIQRAAADKDFKENAPFHAAREQKSLLEGKIMEIEETLAMAVITEHQQAQSQAICVGDTIVLESHDSPVELRYTLVNPKEVQPSKGKISVASPVGKAVLGKSEGETVVVNVPSGTRQYLIKKIER